MIAGDDYIMGQYGFLSIKNIEINFKYIHSKSY